MYARSPLSLRSIIYRFVIGVVTLSAVTANVAAADASLIAVSVGGNPTSGGSFNYLLSLSVLNSGTLTAKASISGPHWKANFPLLTTTPASGVSTVAGPAINVPLSFRGQAMLHVTVFYNGKQIASQSLKVIIAAPKSGPTIVKLYDVGFDTQVTLPPAELQPLLVGTPVTYSWTQFQGPPVTLSATNVPSPTFTTGSLTNFVDLTDTIGVVPFNTLQIGEDANEDLDTYGFQVVVQNGGNSATGHVLVCVASLAPGLDHVPLGGKTYLQTAASQAGQSWTLWSKPARSLAILQGATTRTPWLQPDVEGDYVVRDNLTGSNLTVTAARYNGVQFCGTCHGPNSNVGKADLVTPWSQTDHGTTFQDGVDGALDPAFNESCFFCHTVGYGKQTPVPNGSFGDVQTSVGWQLPAVLQAGNFDAMPAALQHKAGVQCENCHGPGSQHPGEPTLDVKVCATCHQENTTDNFRVGQWQRSPHAQTDDPVKFGHTVGCGSQCHNPAGFVAFTKGEKMLPSGIGKTTCATCHDPHGAGKFPGDAHQVRVYDSVVLGDVTKTNGTVAMDGTVTLNNSTVTLTGKGASATCMTCHNARALPYQNAGTVANPIPNYLKALPHESTASEVLNGIGEAANGRVMGNSAHATLAGCTTCHMFQLAANDPNYNSVGGHTFSLTDRLTGAQNLAACNQCHGGSATITNFDRIAGHGSDYDGNGVTNGVQTEVRGLLAVLAAKFADVGLTVSDAYPFIDATSFSTVTNRYPTQAAPIRRALWNRVLILREGSFGVHNTQFTVRLLQSSYTDLSTNCISLATGVKGHSFAVDYPRAAVR